MSDHLLREPWAFSLCVVLVAMFTGGFVAGYIAGWRLGHPLAVVCGWALNKRGDRPGRATDGGNAACSDCGLRYEQFLMDVVLPDYDWLMIHPEGVSGLLCAACIVKRAAKVHGAVIVFAQLVTGDRHARFAELKNAGLLNSDVPFIPRSWPTMSAHHE